MSQANPQLQQQIIQLINQNQPVSEEQTQLLLTTALDRVLNTIDLSHDEMRAVMLTIMQGKCPDAMMGALLAGLRMKGESIEEITACAEVMRELALTVNLENTPNLVDIVGTGGDGASLFNVSTASAMVMATAGCHVAKHGNGGVSTKSGSSDLLQKAGIHLTLNAEQIAECVKQQNIGFLFAPNHHVAMKYAVPIRRQLKARTIFNILGPLTNPAGVKNAVIGVFNPALCEPLAYVFNNLGANHIMVVSSMDNLDEFSIAGKSLVAELKHGEINVYECEPEDVGLVSQTLKGLTVQSSDESLALIEQTLADISQHPKSDTVQKAVDMVALNAGAGIYVAGLADSHQAGVAIAKDIINSGKAWQKMQEFAKFTQQFVKENA